MSMPSTGLSADDYILAIETSCDDTCAAILRGSGEIVSNVVSSQLVHAEFLGIVPELASREHERLILPVIRQALDEANVDFGDLAGLAVTQGPGLIGCLLVGLATTKGLAYSLGLPFVGVNHLEGHVSAIRAEQDYEPPFVALVASGGHTELMFVSSWDEYQLLGATRDDAAGEAFDKVAKLLGLGFPGGPAIDQWAALGNPKAIRFPRAWLERGSFDFSFSGLKTAVKLYTEKRPPAADATKTERETWLADVCASFQAAVVDVLVGKVERLLDHTGCDRILLSGGVACNRTLRSAMSALAESRGGECAVPPPKLCSDNAAMIGLAGLPRLRRGESDPLDVSAVANLDQLSFGTGGLK